ncbi:MAG: presenilin family intramembrane aspartyl protease [archaeon]
MKHTTKITILLLVMFLVTQFIGIYVVNHYIGQDNELPYGMTPPEAETDKDFYTSFLPSIIIAFIIAITILFFLTKFKAEIILKIWFFLVVTIALGISLGSFLPAFKNSSLLILIIVLPLAFFKIFKRGFVIHNVTELFIYPGIAAVFVPLLNVWTIIILLILLSLYDMWAVWHSGIMQKMAKYQIDKVKAFTGFAVPYVSKKVKTKIKKMKKKDLKKKKIKVNLAILGGGDIIFPIITAGVMLKTLGLGPAILVVLGAALGLGYLFFAAKKKKFYPAMPFITAGIFLSMIISYFIF